MAEVLKTELMNILTEYAPKCKYSAWLKNEIEKLDRWNVPDNFKLVHDLSEGFFSRLSKMNPEQNLEDLKNFTLFCHAHINVLAFTQENETEEQMIKRVISEEMQRDPRKKQNHSR